MEFLNSQEKSQIKLILTRSSMLQTADERRNLLIFCGLEKYCDLFQLDQPLGNFFVSLYVKLSKDYIKVDNSKRLGLIVLLEHLSQIDSSLSTEDQDFIKYIVSEWERRQVSSIDNQQLKQTLFRTNRDLVESALSFEKVIREPSILVGYRIEPYVLQEAIGAGGSGLVYRAWNSNLGQPVCIKIFYPFKSDFAGIATTIARGVRGLAGLNHPNIIKIFDFGHFELENQESFYIVMELVNGNNLDVWNRELPESDESLSKRLQIAFKIAIALRDAHNCKYIDEVGFEQTGVFHGDIKPANILVRFDNSPVLIDFMMLDTQRLLDPKVVPPHLLVLGMKTAACGTPGFMAPEQEREGIVTSRTDVYSLGVTFCHLLFPDSINPIERLQKQEVKPELNTLQILLRKMVDSYPDNRPQDMAEVATAIEIELRAISNTQLELRRNSKADELANIRRNLLLAKSSWELQSCLYQVEEFLSRYSNDVEGRLLKDSILEAIDSPLRIQGIKYSKTMPMSCLSFLILHLLLVGVLYFLVQWILSMLK